MFEVKNAINWYLMKVNNSIAAIEAFKIPVKLDDLRFQYGVLLESIFSLIDYMEDQKNKFGNNKFDIEKKIIAEIGPEGNTIVNYMRELRNSAIHRGLDITGSGSVVKNRIVIVAPDKITNRHGIIIKKPSEQLLDKLLASLDNASKNVTKSELKRLSALEEINFQSINSIAATIKSPPIPKHAPDVIKMMIAAHSKIISEEKAQLWATETYNSALHKLMVNLNVRMNIQHLL